MRRFYVTARVADNGLLIFLTRDGKNSTEDIYQAASHQTSFQAIHPHHDERIKWKPLLVMEDNDGRRFIPV